MTTPPPARRDRKFYTSLALHQAVLRHLSEDPERVVRLGLIGVEAVLPNARGGARERVREWYHLLQARDYRALDALLTGEDGHAVEMRNLTVFAGVLTADERQRIVADVKRRREYATQEAVTNRTAVSLTESERDFVHAAGIPDSAFSTRAEEENALYEAESAVILKRELYDSLLPMHDVAKMLGTDAPHIRRMVASGRLMAAGQLSGQPAFASWQLVNDELLPGLREVLASFPEDFHPLDIQRVMTSPAEELSGRTPQEWLANGEEVCPVLRLVSSLSFQ